MNQIDHAAGNSGLGGDLGQQRRGQGAPFGGLVDHGAAGGERRGDLPGRQHERRVPRRNHADGADGLADRIVDVVLGRHGIAACGFRRLVGEEAVVFGAPDGGGLHEPDRLSRIHALDQRDFPGAGLDRVGQSVQHLAALGARQVAPFGKGFPGRAGRRVNVGFRARGDGIDGRIVDGGQVVEGPAVTGGRFAADVVSQGFPLEAGEKFLRVPAIGFELVSGIGIVEHVKSSPNRHLRNIFNMLNSFGRRSRAMFVTTAVPSLYSGR